MCPQNCKCYVVLEMFRWQKLLLCGCTHCQAEYSCVCVSNAVSLTILESVLLLTLPCLSHYVGNRNLKQINLQCISSFTPRDALGSCPLVFPYYVISKVEENLNTEYGRYLCHENFVKLYYVLHGFTPFCA
jgi:hypothetical protein